MIEAIIGWSTQNRFYVLLFAVALLGAGIYAIKNTPVDAIPDLSDVQVIIKTPYPRPSAAGGGRSSHLPAYYRHARCAKSESRTRLLILW